MVNGPADQLTINAQGTEPLRAASLLSREDEVGVWSNVEMIRGVNQQLLQTMVGGGPESSDPLRQEPDPLQRAARSGSTNLVHSTSRSATYASSVCCSSRSCGLASEAAAATEGTDTTSLQARHCRMSSTTCRRSRPPLCEASDSSSSG